MTGIFDPLEAATFGKAAPTVEQISKVFNQYDTGNTGSLSPSQVLTACQAIANIGCTTSELKSYVKEGLDVAGDGNGKIKLSIFASYLAFEAAKKYKNTTFSTTTATVKTEAYDNPFLDLFNEPTMNAPQNISSTIKVSVTNHLYVQYIICSNKSEKVFLNVNSLRKETFCKCMYTTYTYRGQLDTPPSQQRTSMKGSYSPTIADSIPDWFGMSIADQTDPFAAAFTVPEKGSLTSSVSLDTAAQIMGVTIDTFIPNQNANKLRTQSGVISNDDFAQIFSGNHLSFPSRDILFSDDVKTNNNSMSYEISNKDNILFTDDVKTNVSNQRNISPNKVVKFFFLLHSIFCIVLQITIKLYIF